MAAKRELDIERFGFVYKQKQVAKVLAEFAYVLVEESKDDSDSHTIFNEQNKCKSSTEMVRILSTCLHEMKKCETKVF